MRPSSFSSKQRPENSVAGNPASHIRCNPVKEAQRNETTLLPLQQGEAGGESFISAAFNGGSPLPETSRKFFEPRFGTNFSSVKIHHDAAANASAKKVNALAYASGNHIVFGKNRFAPESDSGKRLLAHELAHVIQQRGRNIGIQRQADSNAETKEELDERFKKECMFYDQEGIKRIRKNSFYCREMLGRIATEEKKDRTPPLFDRWEDIEEEFRNQVIRGDRLLEKLIKHLEANDAVTFFNKLKDLDQYQRRDLRKSSALEKSLKKHLSKKSILNVKLILQFGNKIPESLRKLKLALAEKNIAEAKNLIAFYDELHTDHFEWAQEMVEVLLAAHPKKDDLLFYFLTIFSSSEPEDGNFRAYHYEEDTETNSVKLQEYRQVRNYKMVRTLEAIHLFVPIRFVDQEMQTLPFGLTREEDETVKKWLGGINQIWNNRFEVTNGESTLPLVFSPIITQEGGYTIRVINDESKEKKAQQDADWRGNVSEWEMDFSGKTAAHEFGHLLGNPDEYELPKTAKEIGKPLTEKEKQRTTVEGLGGKPRKGRHGYTYNNIMGDGTEVLSRHVRHFVHEMNKHHLQKGEKPFTLKRISS
jgi:hypothetical protein